MCGSIHQTASLSNHLWWVKRLSVFLDEVLTEAGDIGTTPSEVESALDSHFSRAHKWGCVMLLDEADVFLAKRSVLSHNISSSGMC